MVIRAGLFPLQLDLNVHGHVDDDRVVDFRNLSLDLLDNSVGDHVFDGRLERHDDVVCGVGDCVSDCLDGVLHDASFQEFTGFTIALVNSAKKKEPLYRLYKGSSLFHCFWVLFLDVSS